MSKPLSSLYWAFRSNIHGIFFTGTAKLLFVSSIIRIRNPMRLSLDWLQLPNKWTSQTHYQKTLPTKAFLLRNGHFILNLWITRDSHWLKFTPPCLNSCDSILNPNRNLRPKLPNNWVRPPDSIKAITNVQRSKMHRFIACRSQIYIAPAGFSIRNPEIQLFFMAYPTIICPS